MINTRFYLDCHRIKPGMVLTKKGIRALINTGFSISPNQWDSRRQIVIGHPRKGQLNINLAERKLDVDNIIYRLETSGELGAV